MLKYEKMTDNLKVIEKQLNKILFEIDSIIRIFDKHHEALNADINHLVVRLKKQYTKLDDIFYDVGELNNAI